ncbi:uncharacterized protein LOC114952086 [Acropora millepora]|uniref:uncharacterized protein LOC114952086 n=1 Tax=Acropora millepora TaxID=45264 RepID=UPI001CF1CC59|nr:uncharacterized protein LOC114952086 [Acropora millepora]XP_044168444.1 uncharacterized protein LOC114952086 [Acropora millepora]
MYRLFFVLVFGVILFNTSSYAQIGIEELAEGLTALEQKVQGLSNRVDSATVRCMEMLTPYQWGADEPIVYLDRQNVECPKPYSLTKMRLLRGGKDNNKVAYYYTCCMIVL